MCILLKILKLNKALYTGCNATVRSPTTTFVPDLPPPRKRPLALTRAGTPVSTEPYVRHRYCPLSAGPACQIPHVSLRLRPLAHGSSLFAPHNGRQPTAVHASLLVRSRRYFRWGPRDAVARNATSAPEATRVSTLLIRVIGRRQNSAARHRRWLLSRLPSRTHAAGPCEHGSPAESWTPVPPGTQL